MRTTIDLPNEKRARLLAIAARRGLRGYSVIVNEAIDRYLEEEDRRHAAVRKILALKGTLTDSEAEEADDRIQEAWSRWRLS